MQLDTTGEPATLARLLALFKISLIRTAKATLRPLFDSTSTTVSVQTFVSMRALLVMNFSQATFAESTMPSCVAAMVHQRQRRFRDLQYRATKLAIRCKTDDN
jgi:hypothetical protein